MFLLKCMVLALTLVLIENIFTYLLCILCIRYRIIAKFVYLKAFINLILNYVLISYSVSYSGINLFFHGILDLILGFGHLNVHFFNPVSLFIIANL